MSWKYHNHRHKSKIPRGRDTGHKTGRTYEHYIANKDQTGKPNNYGSNIKQ